MTDALAVWVKSRYFRNLVRRLKRGPERGLFALTGFDKSAHLAPSNMEYGRCKCELGCKCPEANS